METKWIIDQFHCHLTARYNRSFKSHGIRTERDKFIQNWVSQYKTSTIGCPEWPVLFCKRHIKDTEVLKQQSDSIWKLGSFLTAGVSSWQPYGVIKQSPWWSKCYHRPWSSGWRLIPPCCDGSYLNNNNLRFIKQRKWAQFRCVWKLWPRLSVYGRTIAKWGT